MNNADATWAKAHEYERGYWDSRKHDAPGIITDLNSVKALAMVMAKNGFDKKKYDRVLDIGVGGLGVGLLWLFDGNEKYGLDPLPVTQAETGNPFMDELVSRAQAGNEYVNQQAEKMDFEDNHFDLVICNNVLDHTHTPTKILEEIRRVLRNDGVFGFAVDTYSLREQTFRKVDKKIRPNHSSYPGHPFDWTENQMTRILKDTGFEILHHKSRPFRGQMIGRRRRSTWICK